MNKIGIVTIYDLTNYGNRLQNYAVKQILERITGKKIKEISRMKHFMCIKVLYGAIKGNNLARIMKFYNFSRGSLDINYLQDYSDLKYDNIICGSDQIWHPTWAGEPYMFAEFANKNKRISYAASFGKSEIPDEKKAEYAKYLSEMKAISVREEAGAKIVKELTGRDAEVLVDPTLMLDKKDWQKVAKKPGFYKNKKYILTYFLGEVNGKQRQYIEYIAKTKDYEIINLEGECPNKYWYSTGPAEFLWLIEHCEMMLTDSFHGSVFSVLMDVPFIVFDRQGKETQMGSRIDTLLKTLQLPDRRFNNQTIEQAMKKEYSHIPAILEREREKAINFLKNAMEIE